MGLTQKAIDDLKEIHYKEYGEALSDKEGWDMGIDLIRMVKVLCRKDNTVNSEK